MQAILFLLSCVTVCNSLLQGAQLYTDLAKFCSNNGLLYLSVTAPDELPMSSQRAPYQLMTSSYRAPMSSQ